MSQLYPHNQYLKIAVETATPIRLIVMLYDGAIRFLSQALPAMQAHDYETQTRLIGRAQDIIAHLHAHLDHTGDGTLAKDLENVYGPMYDMLTYANIHDTPDRVEKVLWVLREFRESWIAVERQCQTGKAATQDTASRMELLAAQSRPTMNARQ